MLDTLRKRSSGLFATILIGLLVISFAVFGIADMLGGFRASSMAKVGDTEIGQAELERGLRDTIALANRQNQIFARYTRRPFVPLSRAEAIRRGVHNQVLDRLIGFSAIDLHARNLSLGLSDEAAIKEIRANRQFQGLGGQFSERRFDALLNQLGLSRQAYLEQYRSGSVREQVRDAMVADLAVPGPLLDAVNVYRNESRNFDYFLLTKEALEKIPEPSEDVLKKFHKERKRLFTAPEYRELDLLILARETIEKSIPVSDEDIKKEFETRSARYKTPERRRVQQITFPNKEAAQKAYGELKAGKKFIDVAKAAGKTQSDIDLGLLDKAGFVDPKIADAAFKLKKDEFSAPVEGALATAILRVVEIQPEVSRKFEEVKDAIKNEIARARAAEKLDDILEQAEKERDGGATLAEVAAKLKLKYRHIKAVDRTGKDPQGKALTDIPGLARVLRTAFQSDIDVELDPVEAGGRAGYVWLNVKSVTPSALKPFDKVKAEVKKAYMLSELRKALVKKAKELTDRANGGEDFAGLVKVAKASVKQVKDIKRTGSAEKLPRTAITAAFSLAKGKATSVAGADGQSRVVLKVTGITAPKALSKDERKKLAGELVGQMQGDIVTEYIQGLRSRYGVTVNRQAIRRALGQDAAS